MAKFTTAKAAVADQLLKGKTLNVKNCFSLFGITNCAREIPRMIEKPFCVSVTRKEQTGTSRFSQKVSWTDYTLNKKRQSAESLAKMQDYITKHTIK